MPVLCRDCDLVHSDTRKASPWKWRCMARPVPPQAADELVFVDPDYRTEPPYQLCIYTNKTGECESFTPRRTPPGEHA